MDVTTLIEQLRAAVQSARSMPMSSSAVIHRAEVLKLIDELETAVPLALQQSSRVYAERDGLLAEAKAQADRVLEEAELERDRLVSETNVHRIAMREAESLRASVQAECAALRHETDEYVDTRLANFEITLSKTLEAVTRGRDRLHGRHELDQRNLDALAELEDSALPDLPRH